MIKIIKPGILCSVQDGGRLGQRHLGIPISGWMDEVSAKSANLILQNDENDAVIEVGPIGPELLFLEDTVITVTGAPKACLINGEEFSHYKRIPVRTGDKLSIKSSSKGVWTYVGVKDGWQVDKVLGSRSFYPKAGIGEAFHKEMAIKFHSSSLVQENQTNSTLTYNHIKKMVRVTKGPEWSLLSQIQKELLIESVFSISNKSDRMAYYLNHDHENKLGQEQGIITSAVCPGTIQLPPSGVPMVLMKDAQTTGGYTRVLQVYEADLSLLAQKRAGEEIQLQIL